MPIRFIPVIVFLLVIGVPATGISNYTQTSHLPSASDDIINSASHLPSASDDIINSASNLTAEQNFATTHNTTTPRENTESVNNKTDSRSVRRNDLNADNITTTTATSKTSTSASSFITSDIVINEVELNPSGDDTGHQWIELFNPSGKNVSMRNYKIITSFESLKINLPTNATINAEETYLIRLDSQIISHADIVTLEDSLGKTIDRTPSLVDRNDDDYTWQRIPDGYNEWKFASATPDELNDPGAAKSNTSLSIYANSTARCLGSAGCAEGVVIRIVDANTLYVRVDGVIYKVNLSLVEVPTKSEQGHIKATSFTRNLCLGSDVLVDQDDKLLASNGSVIAVVYCSGTNLNSELLNNGFAIIDKNQCGTSEFAGQPWAKAYGC